MALEITKRFSVKAPVAEVWAFLLDPHRVARCLPGAAITGQLDEKTYTGTMVVKVGPVGASYRGQIVFESLDPVARRAEIVGTGQDVRGKGGADLRLTSTLREGANGTTEVTAVSLVNVSGILAQMGRGMIQDVSDQMFRIFSERMRGELESQATAALGATAAAGTAATPAPAGTAPAAASTPPAVPADATAPAGATAPPPPAAPEALDLGAVGGKVAWGVAVRTVTSPVFWFGLVVGVVLDRVLFR